MDRVFKHALLEFKDNLVATYSIVETRGSALKYKDLIGNFLHVMETVCAREGSTLSITMGVNAFRGFMDEFMSQHETDKARTKRKKDKKRKVNKRYDWRNEIDTYRLLEAKVPPSHPHHTCSGRMMWMVGVSCLLLLNSIILPSERKGRS